MTIAQSTAELTPCDPARRFPMTLPAALDLIARRCPNQQIRFPDEDESLSYAELADGARRVAVALTRRGLRPGARVGLLSPNAPEFLQSLFGVLHAGAAVAPLALPIGTDLEDYARRTQQVVAAAGLSHIVLSHRVAARLGPALHGAGVDRLGLLVSSHLLAERGPTAGPDPFGPDPFGPDRFGPDEPAIVQFTSGSTAVPKGVVLSHSNVWHCARSITEAIRLGPDDVHGSWLPLFHDMGLFGALTGLFRGVPLHLWSPAGFVRRPARWLSAFAQIGGTISAMPNFGYDALLDAVPAEQAAELDLSAWRVAFNGAEAVQPASVAAFLDRFAPAGFRPATMVPAYGMAEVTLVATLPPSGRAPVVEWVDRDALTGRGDAVRVDAGAPGARGLVCLGRAVPDMAVRIADGDDVQLDGTVGEIQLRGAMATRGYLGGQELFTADGWLRSGDLGYLRDGELFFTGRLKEMITAGGRNVYPLDVEDAARDVDGVHKGCCVAFAETDPERIVLVAETTVSGAAARADLTRRLRTRVAALADLPGITVHLVSPRTIPRTTSGKLRRLDMRARLRDDNRVNT